MQLPIEKITPSPGRKLIRIQIPCISAVTLLSYQGLMEDSDTELAAIPDPQLTG